MSHGEGGGFFDSLLSADIKMEKLIATVASFPILYDASLSDYKNTLMRTDAWMKVSGIIGYEGEFNFCNVQLVLP